MNNKDFQNKLETLVVEGLNEKSQESLKHLAISFSPSATSVKSLADTCRLPEWRLPLAEAGFLEGVLACGPITKLAVEDADVAYEMLRYICNSVADTDENRATILPYMSDILQSSTIERLRLASLSAILNTCQDYEPGAKELIQHADRQAIPTIFDILALLIPVLPPSENVEAFGTCLAQSILAVTNAPGATSSQDDFVSCMDSFLPILQNDEIQAILANEISECMNLLENCVLRITGRKRLYLTKPAADYDDDEDKTESDIEEEIAELSSQADSLVGILASISYNASFSNKNDLLENEDVQDMIRWLTDEWRFIDAGEIERQHVRFARAGALMLGNIATQPWIVKELIDTSKLVPAAVDAIMGCDDRELLSAAAGLLHNLAIPTFSKKVMQVAGVFKGIAKLLRVKRDGKVDVEVVVSGLKLLRVLLLDSVDNCESFVGGDDVVAQTALLELLQESSVSDARVRTEAGRALVAMYRSLGTAPSKPGHDPASILTSIEAIAAVLSLISHPDPRNKSQGWMGLAVISRNSQGAEQIRQCLKETGQEITLPFEALLKEKESADRPMLGKDKENALVLMANLVRDAKESDGKADAERMKELMKEYGKLRAS